MVYTLGHKQTYDQALAENPMVQKVGRQSGYTGGSVWETEEEARDYLTTNGLQDFDVYGVDADWEQDTAPSESGGEWHDLLRDAPIIRLQ